MTEETRAADRPVQRAPARQTAQAAPPPRPAQVEVRDVTPAQPHAKQEPPKETLPAIRHVHTGINDPAEKPKLTWQPMDTAKRDGRPIWVTDGNGKQMEAVWRDTRRFITGRGRFVEFGFWANLNAGGQALPFEPRGWLPSTGAPHPR